MCCGDGIPADFISVRWQASFGCGVKAAIGPSDHEPKCQPPFCAYDVAVPAIRAAIATNPAFTSISPPLGCCP